MVCMVAMLEFMLCCEILLLLNMVDMDRWEDCGVSNPDYLVHLVHMNRLSAYRRTGFNCEIL